MSKKFDDSSDDWSEYKKVDKKKSKPRKDDDKWASNTRSYSEREYEHGNELYKFRRGK